MATTLTIQDENQILYFGYSSPSVIKVWFDEKRVYFEYDNGKVIGAPLVWYPLLNNASEAQRQNFVIEMGGLGVHWPDIDEDLSAEGMLYVGK